MYVKVKAGSSGQEQKRDGELGMLTAQRIDLRTAAQAVSETFMASNWAPSAASAAASQQLLLPLPLPAQNLSVVLSSTGAPVCRYEMSSEEEGRRSKKAVGNLLASVHSGKAREAGRSSEPTLSSRSAAMAPPGRRISLARCSRLAELQCRLTDRLLQWPLLLCPIICVFLYYLSYALDWSTISFYMVEIVLYCTSTSSWRASIVWVIGLVSTQQRPLA